LPICNALHDMHSPAPLARTRKQAVSTALRSSKKRIRNGSYLVPYVPPNDGAVTAAQHVVQSADREKIGGGGLEFGRHIP